MAILAFGEPESKGPPPETTPHHQRPARWLNPDRDAARDAFARLLDSRERQDTAGTIRAQRELRKLGWRVDLVRPVGNGGGY